MLDMNPTIRTRWVEALRSVTYKQTTTELANERGFCCLGVLCDLAAKEDICAVVIVDQNATSYSIEYNAMSTYLPDVVIKWAGLPNNNPEVRLSNSTFISDPMDPHGVSTVALSDLNDDYEFTFAQIADAIEGKLT